MADLFAGAAPMIFDRDMKREAIERELKLRRSVYPRRIADKKMTQALADKQIAVMEAILKDYQ